MVAVPFNNLITFSRGSNATVTGSNGLIQWAPNNLLTFSEQFDNAAWSKTAVTATANAAIAPDGTRTADALIETTAAGTGHWAFQSATTVAAAYTASCYIKPNGRDWAVLRIRDASSNDRYAWFNIADGTVGTVQTNLVASITSAGDGWFRCAITVSSALAGSNPIVIGAAPSDNVFSYTGDGASGILIWGAQLELGSTATTYNPTTVKNLLGFSEAFDNAAWVKSNSSIVTSAQANPVNGLFNAQKLMENTANSVHRFIVGATVTATPYTLSIYAKASERNWIAVGNTSVAQLAHFNLSNGTVGTIIGGVTAAITNIGSGWYRCSVTFTPAAGAITLAVWLASADNTLTYTGDGNSGVYIYGAQLSDSASLDPYVPTPGAAPSSTAFYGPRFDFDPVTLAPRGLLVEEQRTNLATYSNTFSDASWTAFGTKNLVANSTVSPDGEINASTLTDNSAAAFQGMGKTVTVANDNTTYTASIYVRKTTGGTSATFGVNLQLTGGTLVTAQPRLNTDTGALINGTGTVQNAGAYWRLTTTVTNNTTGNTTLALAVYPATAAYNSGTDSAAATGSAIIYGAQLEAGAFATSYIPTVASTVTRSADVATVTGQNFGQWYGQTAGTFVAEWALANANTTGRYIVKAFSPSVAQGYGLWVNSNSIDTRAWIGATSITAGNASLTVANKASMGYRAGDNAASVNGAAAVTSSATGPTDATYLEIGSAGASYLNGHIRNIRFIPARAADFQLQGLST
jgi:hypothetical protein